MRAWTLATLAAVVAIMVATCIEPIARRAIAQSEGKPAAGGMATRNDDGDTAEHSAEGARKHDADEHTQHFASVPTGKKGIKPPCPVQSLEEVQVLLRLRERHTVLLARESEMAQREVLLKTFEASLREKMAHLTVSLDKIEQQLSLGAAGEKAREQRLQDLVDTVGKLSAKKAAPMLAQAEPTIVAELFRRLGPVRASALLAVMPPATAGKLIDHAAAGPNATSATRASDASAKSTPTSGG